ncbi:MAG: helix-turn-helix transcriptional regulator [Bacteroidota bacterium]
MLRKMRKQRKLSQDQLATISGLHINTIYLLEKGLNEPKLSTFFFIAKAFDLTPMELMKMLTKEYYNE